jgi:hypothetical protein
MSSCNIGAYERFGRIYCPRIRGSISRSVKHVWVLRYLHSLLPEIWYELLHKVKSSHAHCMKSIFISRLNGANKLTIRDRHVR